MFKRVLIANRGEIAVRIIRGLRDQGVETVAVFSSADREAFHVRMAHRACEIGPAPSTESYLRGDRIVETARRAGCDAIHPGYGFLAENADFAQMVTDAGLAFIGPPPSAIRSMGDKIEARRIAAAAGVPIVPGSPDPVEDEAEALRIARSIGFPVLLKAVGGGGGKGMRLVHDAEELRSAMRLTRSEAGAAFGRADVYVEKYVDSPRHIEVQVLADAHGNVIHLGERECSIQRRHQKVVEECPSPVVTPELRQRIGEAAVAAARACGYVNAGTVEFMLDGKGDFYFLEMNTRLQVEHPVTELVTQLDLVREQLHIACGEKLPLRQEDVTWKGVAIECRIYAEDPERGFLPSLGRIDRLRPPDGPGIRLDSGIYRGYQVPVYYDPLLAKLIAWGADRGEAIARMRRALREFILTGVKTTLPFHRWLLRQPDFESGDFTTEYIARRFDPVKMHEGSSRRLQAYMMGAIAAYEAEKVPRTAGGAGNGVGKPGEKPNGGISPWKLAGRAHLGRGRNPHGV